jgi:hypothetical protein
MDEGFGAHLIGQSGLQDDHLLIAVYQILLLDELRHEPNFFTGH